jgi:hypothetical protein
MEMVPDSSDAELTRNDLVARLRLMEEMVAEGRRATGRYGWIFVLWGVVDIAGMFWQMAKPHWFGVWPVTVGVGIGLQALGLRLTGNAGSQTSKNRALTAVWRVMGMTMCLYCFSAMFAHGANGTAYVAAIFMILGMAHAISATILRWGVQGGVGAMWLAGGVACYFVPGQWLIWLFLVEMIVGMVLFGLYATLLEGRHRSGAMLHPA